MRPSFCLSPRGFSLVELGIDRGSEDAAFSVLAAPVFFELFHLAGHRARATTTPVILCVLLLFVRGALLLLPVRGGHRPRHHRRPLQELLFCLWIASIANSSSFFGQARHPALGLRFDLSRQCQRGLRNGFVPVPYTSPYLLSAPPIMGP
jgi:hypothetical protein